MTPLTAIRLNEPLRAFARTGMDFARTFLTVKGRETKDIYAWLRV